MQKIQHDTNTVFVSPWWFMRENSTPLNPEAKQAEEDETCSSVASLSVEAVAPSR